MSFDKSENEVLDFGDLTPISVKVKIGAQEYTLREATGDAEIQYRNAQLANSQLVGEKIVRMAGIADTGPLLVSLCLFDSNGNNVPIPVIRAWPSRVKEKLFERVKEISDIDQPWVVDDLKEHISNLQKKLDKLEETHPN